MKPKRKTLTGTRSMMPKGKQMTSNEMKNEVEDEANGQGRRQ